MTGSQLHLGLLALRDVNARADVANESAVRRRPRIAAVQYPTVLAVSPPESVFHPEVSPRIECRYVFRHAALPIVGMNSFGPAVAEFLRDRSTSEIQPRLVEVNAALGGIRHPDHDWRRIRHRPKSGFTLAKANCLQTTFRDQGCQEHQRRGHGNEEQLQRDHMVGRTGPRKWSASLDGARDRHDRNDQERNVDAEWPEAHGGPEKKRQGEVYESRDTTIARTRLVEDAGTDGD